MLNAILISNIHKLNLYILSLTNIVINIVSCLLILLFISHIHFLPLRKNIMQRYKTIYYRMDISPSMSESKCEPVQRLTKWFKLVKRRKQFSQLFIMRLQRKEQIFFPPVY